MGLRSHGFMPSIATRYTTAKTLFQSETFEAVVCDINLNQHVDGIDFAKNIIQGKVPVIFLTAYSDTQTINRVEPLYPYTFLRKPFNNNQLTLTLKLALKNASNNIPLHRI